MQHEFKCRYCKKMSPNLYMHCIHCGHKRRDIKQLLISIFSFLILGLVLIPLSLIPGLLFYQYEFLCIGAVFLAVSFFLYHRYYKIKKYMTRHLDKSVIL